MKPAEFDYIIVGAGSAGCVLANRLTEDPGVSVLLLEAGSGHSTYQFRMGIGFFRGTPAKLNWGFKSEPEPHLQSRELDLPQGKALGGSSSINGKLYSRGHPGDYDLWEGEGCAGWGWREVLPYFKRSETNWRGESEFHGGSGPLRVSRISAQSMLGEPVLTAAQHLGYCISEDLNGAQTEGFSISDITVDAHGRRSSTARAFLGPARRRRNLTVIRSATASKVLIQSARAVGLEFVHAGRRSRAHARREVILSCGTYNTPKLLMLSGIGSAAELSKHQIPVVQDLPGVGQNVADHASCFIEFSTREPITLLRELRLDRAARWLAQWALAGSGLFASQASSAQALLRTQAHLPQPDLQVFFNPMRMDGKVWVPGVGRRQEHRLNAAMVLLHPQSRGCVRLRSRDPLDPPRICLNLLAEPADIQTFLRGFEIVRALYRAPPLAALVENEFAPGAGVQDPASLMAYMRRSLSTVRHPVGSCRMGLGPDAVVDPQLRVRGMEGLRVVDASIMPAITGGNTNAPTIMIAEKAADLIRN